MTKPTKILRAKESGKFTERFTDEDFLRTVDECLKEATCTAGEVADKLGCNARYARNRLVELEEKGKLTKKLKGTSWGFRP